jgi:iron complex outermembrane receptor protein
VQNQVVGANNVRERVYSQEINIISPDSGAFKYVLGGYAQRNKIDLRNWNSTSRAFTTLPQPMTNKLLLGVFGQATYQLAPKFSVDAGLRYSHFHVDGFGAVYRAAAGSTIDQVISVPPVGATVLVPQTGSEGDGRMTGKLALNFKPDADNLLFVFAARGYKNGGINPPGGSFRPNRVGLRSRVEIQLLRSSSEDAEGAFYMKYNFQMDVINPLSGQSGVVNLANSDIKGFEASFRGKFDALSIDGGLSFVDSSLSAVACQQVGDPGGRQPAAVQPRRHPRHGGHGLLQLCHHQHLGRAEPLQPEVDLERLGGLSHRSGRHAHAHAAPGICLHRLAVGLSDLPGFDRPDCRAWPAARQHHARHGHVQGRGLWHQPGQQVLRGRAGQQERTVWRAAWAGLRLSKTF